MQSHVMFFADDTSLFSIIKDPMVSAHELQQGLNLISEWARQWKMSFNPDPTKQAEEILFSNKKFRVIIHHFISISRLKG